MLSKLLPKWTLRLMLISAILLALRYIVGLVGTITIIPNILKFGFSFIPNTLIGAICGVWSGLIFIVYDLFQMIVSGKGSQIIPLWTLFEGIQGLLYGLFFYKHPVDPKRLSSWLYVSLAVFAIMLVGSFLGTPFLLQLYYKVSFQAQYIGGRWLKVLEWPLRVVVIMVVLPQLQRIPIIKKYL